MELLLSGCEAIEGEPSNVLCHNLHTGTLVSTFRQSSPAKNATCTTLNHLLSAQHTRPQLNIHNFGKEILDQSIILPEILICVQSSPCGSWLAAGTEKGNLYIWSLKSGALIHFFRAHYQPLTILKFSNDGMVLFTASNDGDVFAWLISTLVDQNSTFETSNSSVKAISHFSGHKRSIVSMEIGPGPIVSGRLYTASEDNTIRIWDVSTGNLLTTIALPSTPSCMTVDPSERVVYVGNEKGIIWIPLYTGSSTFSNNVKEQKRVTSVDNTTIPNAIGGMGRVVDYNDSRESSIISCQSPITTLTVSFDASLLISGDKDGNVLVWDSVSRQVLRRLVQYYSPVSFLQCKVDKISFCSNSSLSFPVLKRMITNEYLNSDVRICIQDDGVEQLMQPENILKISSDIVTQGSESSWRAKAETSEMQLKEAKRLFYELKQVHQALWEKYLQK
ncbi:Pre-rRNA-processing protein crb3/ipi3 [Schizosaccharomyces pombe]